MQSKIERLYSILKSSPYVKRIPVTFLLFPFGHFVKQDTETFIIYDIRRVPLIRDKRTEEISHWRKV